MLNKYVVDRIEGDYVVIQSYNGDIKEILLSQIKNNPHEGDVLIKDGDNFVIDVKETQNRKSKINNMMKNMWK